MCVQNGDNVQLAFGDGDIVFIQACLHEQNNELENTVQLVAGCGRDKDGAVVGVSAQSELGAWSES